MALEQICLQRLFQNQAEKTPAELAVVSREGPMTYSDLDRESDALGAYLQQHGVLRDDRVGIFMESCSDYVTACIGALKAGGAFMPLELESPDNLLKTILEEAKPKVVITKQSYASRLSSYPGLQVLSIDSDDAWKDTVESHPVITEQRDLAFVPYTSGTTGDPKGVMQTHAAMVSSYFGRYDFSSYQTGDRVACNIFFTWEFLRPLLKGGTVYVIPDDVIFLPRTLTKYISDNRITEVLFTPSLLQAVLNSDDPETLRNELESLRVVWLNGEVVPGSLKEQAFGVLSRSARLFNTYSISEAHDVCTVELKSVAGSVEEVCPVGLPVPGVQVRVLPEDSAGLDKSGTGELYIGGTGLARGYLERPDLDEERFLHVDGERYYATGDVAEIDADGVVTVVGRNDSMVKIRGYSVYLGAIEEILRKHCDVLDAAVTVEGEDESNRWLVSYVVRKPDACWLVDTNSATSKDLRNVLERYLPHYSVPSRYVELESLPINQQTGKLDRKALPAPRRATARQREIAMVASQATSPEGRALMRGLWSEALGIEAGALDDAWDFFDLGGNSLTGLGLTLGIEQAFDIKLQGNEIYDHRTIDTLVSFLADGESLMSDKISLSDEAQLDPDIVPASAGSPVRLSEASNIFFTGATGYLGAFLLDELLRFTGPDTTIYCLARGNAQSATANTRVVDALKFYELPSQTMQDRIVTLSGDLTQSQFGLSDEEYRRLAGEVDYIFHCAASVNYAYNYETIKPHTVGGTTEVIKFACHTKAKPLLYLSSNGIFPGGDTEPYLENKDIDGFAERMEGGYNQAKWVAERLVWSAVTRGLPVCLVRPGNIGHHSVTGVLNPNDFQTLIIKACLRVGSAPVAPDWFFEMTPVDFLATAITKIADDSAHLGQVYNVVQQEPVRADDVFTRMRDTGLVAELLPMTEWRSRLQETADNANDVELKILSQSLDSVEGYLSDTSVYDISRFSEISTEMGLAPPTVDVDYVTMFLRGQ
jgi:amino acid adenylation domain-containing protein/thioester reductase-like protein